ncbi:FumA C-terminus/TtdB family hydratase beta subunit [Minwuia thermotolerans]|uniref:Fumarate hydratase class I n=1 Tax=Minwuia thermotolerans TaxID=2056226 RepID=A0A2M9G309_9PROT|nr:FumA C-terminus/TtdB family hydratase beta subunit [Minwuia thermotolerans]PJK30101.1 fumarate hydratase [Minwuia thermotolerans]
MTEYQPLFPLGADTAEYRKLDVDGVKTETLGGRSFTVIEPHAISHLAETAFADISHLFRKAHLEQLRSILDDPEASANDRFVALELLKNANISAAMEYPSCQDTGTAIISGKKGQYVLVEGDDGAALSEGVQRTWASRNLRYSQMAPLSMFEEKNTGSNLPAQIDIEAVGGDAYKFLFVAKGGGSANKTFLFQQTRRVLDPERLMVFFAEELPKLGTAACPPYHLAIVIGGMSAEQTLKTVKMASTKYYDELPTEGSMSGHAFRDIGLEQEIHKLTQNLGIGAQFGGKYFCHDVRVIRLPRHGASLPIGIGVSCSADRQAKAKITGEGVFMEALVRDPSVYLPEKEIDMGDAVSIDLNLPMNEIRSILTRLPVETPVLLSGTMIVARDIVHAELSKRVAQGGELPDYIKNHPVYYAGPAKTPEGRASGAFGPTTAARMDPYVAEFQALGGSMVSIAKGNRSKQVVNSCKQHGGFYLGSIGGAAARVGQDEITNVEVLDFEELGMEAVWKIDVQNFPAFVVIDDKGNDFFDFNRKRESDA